MILHHSVIDYIRALSDGRDATTIAGERTAYDRHLASAARLIVLMAYEDTAPVAEWLRREEYDFGRGYLSGEPGERVERAFLALQALLRAW